MPGASERECARAFCLVEAVTAKVSRAGGTILP